jgi:carboxyl-terminal processing protease
VYRLNSKWKKLILVVIVVAVLTGVGSLYVWGSRNNLGNLFHTYALVEGQYLKPVSTSTLIEGAAKGIVEALGDPYSVYMDKDTFSDLNSQIEGAFGGIGVEIDLNKDNRLVVVAPLPGTPASRAGLKTGDIIAAIDNKSTDQMSLTEAAKLLRGKIGSSVLLKIGDPGKGTVRTVTMVREQISVPAVTGKILPDHPNIAYLQVMHFNQTGTMSQFKESMAKLNKAGYQGMILDLRGNPGGDLQTCMDLAAYFLKHGPVVRIVNRNGQQQSWEPAQVDGRIKVPLVVLVDEGSASASEILAGAIKDTGSGILVGTKTFGKGLVQTVFNLGNGAGVKLTTNKYLTPNGTDINKKGIIPDVVVKQPANTDKDVQLEKATQVLEESMTPAGKQAA